MEGIKDTNNHLLEQVDSLVTKDTPLVEIDLNAAVADQELTIRLMGVKSLPKAEARALAVLLELAALQVERLAPQKEDLPF